ncbi:NAD(P)H-quinone oxidoreductase [Paracoccus versutus]|uniref:NAD(P)H-quinone oxidoreductase n=1 Tax=Paracoccus versutus TaxID=34007 RepID=UPI000DF7F169|nr:NAD(P)H-quinone oxidoreductase [Paracoccus versutus]RDD69851.1 NAD(P)H-quinone oxidoreductase [Paracoccus versutus]
MKAVHAIPDATSGTLLLGERPDPVAGAGEVVIAVAGAGINRADILQRRGRYNLPRGASDILGLEVSGRVVEVGAGVNQAWIGREVVALLASGGYATRVAADIRTVLPVPAGLDLLAAAGVIEAAATVVSNLVLVAEFVPGETVLIHGATGGIGTFAIQLVRALGGRVAVTASTAEKLEAARALGAEILVNYRTEDFAARMQEEGGADIILDTVAGSYLDANLRALRTHGRIVTIGMQGGSQGELDFALLTRKKARIAGTLLRDRPVEEKEHILRKTRDIAWPLIEGGRIATRPDRIFPLSAVEAAHAYFESGSHVGKVLLDCRET